MSARAFAVGNDLFFAAGEFRPGSPDGDALIAHEVAHVVQGHGAMTHGALTVSSPGDPLELEAEAMVREFQAGDCSRWRMAPRAADPQTKLARQAAEAMEFEPEVESVEDETESLEPEGRRRERYAAPSFEALVRRNRVREYAEQVRIEQERPVATLDRGGAAPGFTTEHGTRQYDWIGGPGGGGSVEVHVRRFHILDAIEDDVARANTEDDLQAIVDRYLGVVGLVNRAIDPRRRLGPLFLPDLLRGPMPMPVIPEDLDPRGLIRTRVLEAAVNRRAQQVPALAQSRLAPRSRRRGGCRIEPMAPLGDDPLSVLYCHLATGSPYSYRITIESAAGAATQRWAEIDSLRGNTWYECKCGYEALLTGQARGPGVARAVLEKLDHQVLNHVDIARTCGLEYRYIVSNNTVADILRDRWHGNVVVDVVPFEGCD